MPHHIIADGTDMNKVIQTISLHTSITFRKDFYIDHYTRVKQKLDELEEKLRDVLLFYFESSNLSFDQITNHEWNVQFSERDELELYERNGG